LPFNPPNPLVFILYLVYLSWC